MTTSSTAPSADGRRPSPIRGWRPWLFVLLDVMAVAWMTTAGGWFDDRFAVITLGGHHHLVAALAATSFVILAGLAGSTRGFARASGPELGLLAVAVVLTLVAWAGLLILVLLVVLGGTTLGLLVKLARR
ncbi:hypothetical protein [Kineosporia sp. NBRC 101731]|uniref:hypothetical protein n=1 Tax=Kineosporia sp. NBRC 101731 TaxID=3032199 RepID=UPI00255793FF|nr:hypothetical protein [Kineosporia sp. NBRC 101731]